MTTNTPESFDCLAYKQQTQREIYEQTRHLSPQEQVQWFQESMQHGPFADWWQSLPSRTTSTAMPVTQE